MERWPIPEDGTIALGTVADFEKDGPPLIVQEKIAYEIAGNGSVTIKPFVSYRHMGPDDYPSYMGEGGDYQRARCRPGSAHEGMATRFRNGKQIEHRSSHV